MRVLRVIAAATLLVVPAACGESGSGDRREVCGTWIGAPADGVDRSPWHLDVTAGAPPQPVPLYVDVARPPVQLSIVNLVVTADCAHGATVSEAGSTLLHLTAEVRARDGRTAVALIEPERVGRATVVVARPGHDDVLVRFVVSPADSSS